PADRVRARRAAAALLHDPHQPRHAARHHAAGAAHRVVLPRRRRHRGGLAALAGRRLSVAGSPRQLRVAAMMALGVTGAGAQSLTPVPSANPKAPGVIAPNVLSVEAGADLARDRLD